MSSKDPRSPYWVNGRFCKVFNFIALFFLLDATFESFDNLFCNASFNYFSSGSSSFSTAFSYLSGDSLNTSWGLFSLLEFLTSATFYSVWGTSFFSFSTFSFSSYCFFILSWTASLFRFTFSIIPSSLSSRSAFFISSFFIYGIYTGACCWLA